MVETLDPALPNGVLTSAARLLRHASEQDLMLATAESCTGGLLATLLTDMPGRSHVFDRGFVVYSAAAKCDLLNIERSKVDDCGPVSREVAIAMAEGALARSAAHIALAITGFAGPGEPGDEEGLVHFACARAGYPTRHREEHFGAIGRSGVRIAAVTVALEMLEEVLG